MEFIGDAVGVSDVEGMKKMGIRCVCLVEKQYEHVTLRGYITFTRWKEVAWVKKREEGIDVLQLTMQGVTSCRPGELAKLISETFSEMIFTHGHVHCDPHAANMLVRKGGDGRMQLVLLDHGLYRTLSDEFRMEYAGLWRALIFADEAGIRRHSEGMNAGAAVPVFAALITQRPWEHVSADTETVCEVDSNVIDS